MKHKRPDNGKTLRSNPIRYRWIIVFQAAVVTLAVHAVLLGVTRYQPERKTVAAVGESAITFLGPQALTPEEWRQFDRWAAIHDPGLFSRTDNRAGYAALTAEPNFSRSAPPVRPTPFSAPAPLRIPGFTALAPLNRRTAETTPEFFRPPQPPQPAARPLPPQIRDGENRPLTLAKLNTNLDRGAKRPTVIRCRKAGGVVRQSLLESCGDDGLDVIALQALARSADELPEATVLTIYWPENGPRR